MYLPIEQVRLAAEPGLRWMQTLQEVSNQAAAKLGIGDEEVAGATQASANVTPEGHLHLRVNFPGGLWADATVPWTQWRLTGELQ